jgi:hypothetical protein
MFLVVVQNIYIEFVSWLIDQPEDAARGMINVLTTRL